MFSRTEHAFHGSLAQRVAWQVGVVVLGALCLGVALFMASFARIELVVTGIMIGSLATYVMVRLANESLVLRRRLAQARREIETVGAVDRDLRDTVRRQQAVLESTRAAFVFIDATGAYTHVSAGAAALFGRRGQIRLGEHIELDVPPAGHEPFYRGLSRARENETCQELDLYFPVWGRWLATRIEPCGADLSVLFRDVTEEHLALERVQEAEESLRVFAENVDDVFRVVQRQPTRILYVSPAFEQVWGIPVEALYADPCLWQRAVHPEDRARLNRHLARSLSAQDEQRFETEFRIVRPDGTIRWMHDRAVALRDANGQMERLCGITSDITERKRIEASLRESETRFRTLAESSPVGIFRTDLRRRVIDLNARLTEICGVPSERLAGRSLLEVVHEDDRATVANAWAHMARDVRENRWEFRVAHSSGETRHVLMRVVAERSADGTHIGYTGTMSDVTEYREVQTRLLLSERMASLGTLAAGVGHEINNPLTYVMCNIEIALRTMQGLRSQWPEEERLARTSELLRIAFEGSCRIRDIVRELRVFSRSESDALEQVNVLSCVETAVSMALNQIRPRATLVRELAEVPEVRANRVRLGQVVLNLVVNAAQAMPEGHADEQRLTVATRYEPERDSVLIEVRDTGTGIPPELITRIFDPFFTTKSFGEGTGLGLFIAQQTIRSYGGSISVESELGRGSVFRVRMPALHDQRSLPAVSEEIRPMPPRRARILIVDDEPEVGRSVAELLGGHHELVVETEARAALARLAKESFDLILCDLIMPVMNARAFYRELVHLSPRKAERVHFMTGGAFTDDARALVAEAGRPLLNKPFSLTTIESLVLESLTT